MSRSGQPVVGADTRTVQDGRKTSRSQEIDVNSFHEETVSSDRSVQPVVETIVKPTHVYLTTVRASTLNWHMIDRGNPFVETNTENVPDSCQTRSCHESIRFKVGDETLDDRTGRPVVNHDDFSHEKTMLKECRHGLPNSRANTFCCEARAEYQRS